MVTSLSSSSSSSPAPSLPFSSYAPSPPPSPTSIIEKEANQDNNNQFIHGVKHSMNRDSVNLLICEKDFFSNFKGYNLVVTSNNDVRILASNHLTDDDCQANRLALIAKHWEKSTNPTKHKLDQIDPNNSNRVTNPFIKVENTNPTKHKLDQIDPFIKVENNNPSQPLINRNHIRSLFCSQYGGLVAKMSNIHNDTDQITIKEFGDRQTCLDQRASFIMKTWSK